MNPRTKLMVQCFAVTVYVFVSTWIGFYITNTLFGIQYKAEVELLTSGFGKVAMISELILYVPIMLLAGVWVYDAFWKESNVHPGMNIVFHSVILISGIFFVTRMIITYDAFNRSKLPVTVIVLVNYFHDTAYFQLPMTPLLMTLERLIATKQVKTYELSPSTGAVTCLVLVSWTYAITVNFASVFSLGSDVYFTTAYMHCVLQTGTIVLMVCIYRKNLKRYQQIKAKTLTERYQTAENIRLLRATLKVSVIMIMWNALMFTVSFVLKVPDVPAYEQMVKYVWSMWDLIIASGLFLILLIYFHSVGILQKLYSLASKNEEPQSKAVFRSVTGILVPTTSRTQDYFDQLKKSWQ